MPNGKQEELTGVL